MSTSNFIPLPDGFPLVVGGMDYSEEEYNSPYFEELRDLDMFDAENMAEAFSENLKYYSVTVRGGYYAGFQFYIEEKYIEFFDLDPHSRACMENEDALCYFGVTKNKALKEAAAEKQKICAWLSAVARENGYDMLQSIGMFSNGATIYRTYSA